jgi:chaperone required for assembly of F1-ATPase
VAQKGFHEPGEKPRRFYKAVEVRPVAAGMGEGGFEVLLDGRSPRSSKGAKLTAPTQALAELCAEEWARQGEFIDMQSMSATRLAFTALEAIPPSREAVADQFAEYAGSDLICYFAEEPDTLVQRQTEHWGPVLERAEQELALAFVRAAGIRHRTQPETTLATVKALALECDDFGLAGLAFGAPLFGSAILTLALQRGWLTGEQAHALSRVDEAYQEEKWGIDEEAAERTAHLLEESLMLERWFRALG